MEHPRATLSSPASASSSSRALCARVDARSFTKISTVRFPRATPRRSRRRRSPLFSTRPPRPPPRRRRGDREAFATERARRDRERRWTDPRSGCATHTGHTARTGETLAPCATSIEATRGTSRWHPAVHHPRRRRPPREPPGHVNVLRLTSPSSRRAARGESEQRSLRRGEPASHRRRRPQAFARTAPARGGAILAVVASVARSIARRSPISKGNRRVDGARREVASAQRRISGAARAAVREATRRGSRPRGDGVEGGDAATVRARGLPPRPRRVPRASETRRGTRAAARDSRHTRGKPVPGRSGASSRSSNTSRHIEHRRCAGGEGGRGGREGREGGGGREGQEQWPWTGRDGGGAAALGGRRCRNFYLPPMIF